MRPKIIVTIIGVAFLVLSLAAIIEQERIESTISTDRVRRPEKPIAPRLRMVSPAQISTREKFICQKREEQQRLLRLNMVPLEELWASITGDLTPVEPDDWLKDIENIAQANRIEEEIQAALNDP